MGDIMDTNTWQEKNEKEIKAVNEKFNFLGYALLIIGGITFAIGLFNTLFYNFLTWPVMIYGLVVAGLGEIIDLLHRIYINTKK